jgi:hypothetical protein
MTTSKKVRHYEKGRIENIQFGRNVVVKNNEI